MSTQPSSHIEVKPNPAPGRPYEVRIHAPEFTCLCPMTGQPDFAVIEVVYTPDAFIMELKSFKLYLWSYRDRGVFHEAAVNTILDDLVAAVEPRRMTVSGVFNVRGGITTTVTAQFSRD